jgi:hypothetical protein
VKYPEEDSWTQVREGTGQEIQDWVNAELGVPCALEIVERGVIPCKEDLDLTKECQDVALKIVQLLAPLPAVEPVDHTWEVQMGYRERREMQSWRIREQKRVEIIAHYFQEGLKDPEYQEFWAGLRENFRRDEDRWIKMNSRSGLRRMWYRTTSSSISKHESEKECGPKPGSNGRRTRNCNLVSLSNASNQKLKHHSL